ncbi:TetR/AcrR family transcriptional regulator C-terminal domain-containing protein [Microbacterium sp.]|uniref:TetR/AcrR family transcriptional regulator n=1 Tax=Microbacterium sp. TaxID=51671 RepID=UPI003341EB86
MDDAELEELPRGIALAWGVAASPQRGPKREMSVERIVDAAVELADAEGLAAVSMAAVAARLGYTPMSLYRYISAKDDLVLLMQEAAIGTPPPIEGESWRARVVAFHDALMAAYLSHAWVIELPITGVTATPNSAAWMDAGIAAFDGTALGDDARLSLMLLLTGYAHWSAGVTAGMTRRAVASGRGVDEVNHAEDDLLARLVTPDEYPSLHRAIAAGELSSGGDPFRFGLDRILDGITTHLDRIERGEVVAASLPEPASVDPAVAADKRVKTATKGVREAEKALRAAQKAERQARREAQERIERAKSA